MKCGLCCVTQRVTFARLRLIQDSLTSKHTISVLPVRDVSGNPRNLGEKRLLEERQ